MKDNFRGTSNLFGRPTFYKETSSQELAEYQKLWSLFSEVSYTKVFLKNVSKTLSSSFLNANKLQMRKVVGVITINQCQLNNYLHTIGHVSNKEINIYIVCDCPLYSNVRLSALENCEIHIIDLLSLDIDELNRRRRLKDPPISCC